MDSHSSQLARDIDRSARMESYGVAETTPLWMSGIDHDDIDHRTTVDLSDRRLVSIIRLRLVTDDDYPLWDVSYCYGLLTDGRKVRVWLGTDRIRKIGRGRRATVNKGHLIELAKDAKRFAKKIGLLDNISTMA